MRSLILGATGLIGSHLIRHCDDRGDARLGTWYRYSKPDHVPLDLRDAVGVAELVADYEPDVTFLAAGLNNAAYADDFPTECHDITIAGTRHVIDAVNRSGGMLVLFTSDEVFGESPITRRESDAVQPMGILARSQAEAECMVRRELPNNHLILRSSWVFGEEPRHRNLASLWTRRLARGESVEAATDQHGQPTYAGDLAEVALDLAKLGQTGTYHVVGPDRHSAFTFARLVAHIFGYDTDLIEGRTAEKLGLFTSRPSQVWLDRMKLRSLLGPNAVRSTGDGLRAMRTAMKLHRSRQAA